MRKLIPILLGLATLPAASAPFDYMAELRQKEQAVADAAQRRFPLIMLAFAQSFVDASEQPMRTYVGADPAVSPDAQEAAADAGRAREMLEEFRPREALAAIVEAARDRQIVILNEAHYAPRHRAFSTMLALELRKLGFEYLAVETLDHRTPEVVAGLRARGYPLVEDGYYSREPLFGDLLRRALAAGYQPVAYEFDEYVGDYEKLGSLERQLQRESGQAKNIIDQVLAKNPRARIFVHVGHGHVSKGLTDFDGQQIGMMAEQLRVRSGIDPLCIEQTRSAWPRHIRRDQPLTEAVWKNFSGDSFVLARRKGTGFWNPGDVDITVWHRPETLRRGRPTWLAMNGYRRPMKIPARLLPRQGRRLVQAFVAGETAEAVPMDQVLVTAGAASPVFMLPKGRYRFAYQD